MTKFRNALKNGLAILAIPLLWLGLVSFDYAPEPPQGMQFLPVVIQPFSSADYGVDTVTRMFAPMDEDIINDAQNDLGETSLPSATLISVVDNPGNSPEDTPGNGPPDDPGNGNPPDDPGNGNPPDDPGNGTPPEDPGNGTPPEDPGNGNKPDNPGKGNGKPEENPGNGNKPDDPGNGNKPDDPGNGKNK